LRIFALIPLYFDSSKSNNFAASSGADRVSDVLRVNVDAAAKYNIVNVLSVQDSAAELICLALEVIARPCARVYANGFVSQCNASDVVYDIVKETLSDNKKGFIQGPFRNDVR
jgi:hypothetical protein